MSITIKHQVDQPNLGLGLVYLKGVKVASAPEPLAQELDRLIDIRKSAELSPEEELLRKGSRDILRNGKYKPTGRGKPASEYLIRAAKEDTFPRINGPVDANNLVSLKYCVPISLWDLDLAQTSEFEFRLGEPEEKYQFNPSGQELQLKDLVCGCSTVPLVTPIKDGMATKINEQTTNLAGSIYFPLQAGTNLEEITKEFLEWLLLCGETGSWAVAKPGETITLE